MNLPRSSLKDTLRELKTTEALTPLHELKTIEALKDHIWPEIAEIET